MSASFARLATATAGTRRPPALAGGKRGPAADYLTGLRCLPLMPADAELLERCALTATGELLQTAVQGSPDIREGDLLIVDAREYPIRAVADWPWIDASSPSGGASMTRFLVLEQPSVDKWSSVPA